jgi:hypothetical protein
LRGDDDIGIPNEPAEDGTRGFIEGPRPEVYEARKPNYEIVRKDRVVLEINDL